MSNNDQLVVPIVEPASVRQGSTDDLLPDEIQGNCFTNLWLCQNRCVQVSWVSFHATVCLANLVCLGLSATFDTLCAVKQGKSVVYCTEKILIPKPQLFVIVFYITTITNAIAVMTILYLKPACVKFCGFKEAFRQLIRKGSFWSFNIKCIVFVSDYVLIAFKSNLEIVNRTLAITLVIFCASRLIVAYFLNYVFPVKFPAANERCFARLYIWLAYWITLVIFFLATAHFALAITLDVVEKISPIGGKVQTGSHNIATVCRLIVLGIKATFEGRLFLFYWNKIFHGDKDLFSTFIVLKSIQEQPTSTSRIAPNRRSSFP